MSAIDVASGIIVNARGEVLLAERPLGKTLAGLWEFPGGKIDPGETPEQALHRELKEELNLEVRIERTLGIFPYAYDWVEIRLHVFIVSSLNAPQTTPDVQKFQWVDPYAIDPYTLAAADIEPLREYLKISGPGAG